MVHTVVADNGVGMDIQQKEALFSAGGTQSRFGTDGEHGTGIGLLLCREYVARNGGQLHVASAPGCGSAFTVSLPMPAAMQTAVA
jgi:signal transduction histidine kinase